MDDEKRKILVVDDDDQVRLLIVKIINKILGNKTIVEEAMNGKVGLEKIVDHGYEFWAVVSDINMPVMDGLEMLKRGMKYIPQARKIVMTGCFFDETIPDMIISFIPKPFDIEEIKKILE
jgi:YesN/AraC family two-component response regulator